MKDYFAIYNHKKAMEDRMNYGNSFHKRIKRKWYNPFRYLMGEQTSKRINPKKFYKQ